MRGERCRVRRRAAVPGATASRPAGRVPALLPLGRCGRDCSGLLDGSSSLGSCGTAEGRRWAALRAGGRWPWCLGRGGRAGSCFGIAVARWPSLPPWVSRALPGAAVAQLKQSLCFHEEQ